MLLGRDDERSCIDGLLDRARQANSGVLVIRGDPGVGKSSLLELARDRASGMLILACEGVQSESHLPYAGLHQLLRPILDHLDRLPAPQARALAGALGLGPGAADEWFLVSAAVLTLLAEAAERTPLLCLVDDAQWLDDASAESLVFAARRLRAERIAMLFATREGEVRAFDAPGLVELPLGGLDAGAAGALLDHHSRVPLAAEARERLIAETGGNPLALLALSRSLSEAQLTGAEPLLQPIPVSARVEQVYLARVRRLPEDSQMLLLVAAAEETGELATVLGAAAHLGIGLDALDAAEESALVCVSSTRVEFRHPLARSAVYHGAALSKRHAAHGAIASALAGESNADRRVWHLAAACVRPDPAVVAELEAAAERARLRSGFVASSLAFERAAAIAADDRHRVQLLCSAVESAWFAGRLDHARSLLARARPLASGAVERAELSRWRGVIDTTAGVPADARDVLVAGADEISAIDHERALYMLAVACLAAGYSGDGEGVMAIAERAPQVASETGPVYRFLHAFVRGAACYFAGAFDRAVPSLRATMQLAEEADAAAPRMFLGLLIFAGTAALFLGEDEAADRFNRRLLTQMRDAGAVALLTQAVPREALTEVATGRWASASASLNEGIELGLQTGQHQLIAHMRSELALIAGLRGDEDACRSLAADSLELAAPRALVHVEHAAQWALLNLELGRGDADAALLHARNMTRRPVTLWAALDRIEAAVRAGDTTSAGLWLADLDAWARSTGLAWQRAATLHCRALLAEDQSETDRLFQAALDAHADSPRVFHRARSEFAYGEHLRRGRRRIEAREHLRNALGAFETLRAAQWAERARQELRASGQTARRRDPSSRDELSPQEIQIAQFVAQGLSNREVAAHLFLSPRTIDFHLRNIFRKLAITSRMQLARIDLDPEPHAAESSASLVRT
jgi:DNA-binding CsgD family transcriptional regulator